MSAFLRKIEISEWRRIQTVFVLEYKLLAPYGAIQQNQPQVSTSYRSRDIQSTLTVSFHLKWVLGQITASRDLRKGDIHLWSCLTITYAIVNRHLIISNVNLKSSNWTGSVLHTYSNSATESFHSPLASKTMNNTVWIMLRLTRFNKDRSARY